MIRLPVRKSRQSNPVKLGNEESVRGGQMGWNVDVKIDLAACIGRALAGLAVLVLAVGAVAYPDRGPGPYTAQIVSAALKHTQNTK